MKAQIEITREGNEIRIARYYGLNGISVEIPLCDVDEIIEILIKIVKEA